ncbi:MAG: ATP-binding protein [Gemmatimonadota bacterium]|nr:ATP-binding protein [Gemmatimonadota bacterium]
MQVAGESPITVVGIGASAGGLEALSQLFSQIPAHTGLAYVVVQHLSPTHESILAELIGRRTKVPIHQAANGMRVAVDCAYVIAPDTEMTLADGHLKLVPRAAGSRPPRPIDAFLRSLAEVHGSRTIGVILSGTGSDGALGVQDIRRAGGITFVEDPRSAGSTGMPLAAIATGSVDVVAPAGEIGTQLAQLGRHPYMRHERPSPEDASVTSAEHAAVTNEGEEAGSATSHEGRRDDGASAIGSLLRRRFAVDFTLYKTGTIERRIRRRMALRKIDSFAAYVDVLRQDQKELEALYGDLLIGVTRFFRDPEVFALLSRTFLPHILANRSALTRRNRDNPQPVRAWVAGCSTGEEAYTYAICLLEFLEGSAPGTPVQIFATDLSEAAIAIARAGVYPQGIEADVTPERLRRYFTQDERGYRVSKVVRDCCIFARQNIMADPPFSQMDLVSCRNVLIYLQPSVHAKLLAVFHYALKPDGVLVLGTSESTSTAPALFKPIDKKYRIYERAPGPARPLHLDFAGADARHSAAHPHRRRDESLGDSPGATGIFRGEGRQPTSVPDVQRAADQVVLGAYAPAAVVVDDQLQIVQFRGQTGSYLEPTAGTASLQLLSLVKPELASALRTALTSAREEARVVRVEDVTFHDGGRLGHVALRVTPFRIAASGAQYFVVSFEEDGGGSHDEHDDERDHSARAATKTSTRAGGRKAGGTTDGASSSSKRRGSASPDAKIIGELRQELAAAERHLQALGEEHASAVEEFQAANEEIQSSNEELQSTNEEVETAKEELQSLNEELTTLNDELRLRNAEASRLNDDLTNLLTSMHVPVIIVGTDLCIRRFTAGAERLVNLIPTDIGRPIGDIKTNIDVAQLDDLIAHVISTLEVIEREVRDVDGHWFQMHIRPYRTADHKIDGAVLIYYDIDARKRATEHEEGARKYAEAVVQTVREPLLVLDGEFRALTANRAFYDTFETSAEKTIGHSLFEMGNGQWNIPSLRALLDHVITRGDSFNDVAVEHDLPSQRHRTMLLNARYVPSDRNGQPMLLLALADVTERRQVALQLERANVELLGRARELESVVTELRGKTAEALASSRAKTDFLATMSHELRTPLNAIGGYAQLLDLGLRGPVTAAQRTDLARISRSQEHLLGLINEILNFAKLEAGVVPIAFVPVNVRELLESVEAMVAPQMTLKSLHYQVHSAADECTPALALYADEDKVRQILLNLLTNALKFTEPGGRVDIRCDATERRVAILVADTGIGISPDHLSRIFEPFVQVNTSLTRPNDGVGLGLAISRDLARAMNGDIVTESVLGKGSTFTLLLPRAAVSTDE